MGQVAVPAALSGLGLLAGSDANHAASSQAQHQQRTADQLAARQSALFDQMLGIVDNARSGGQFDPTKQLNQLQADTQHYASTDLGNTAGAARSLGFQPGDTAPMQQLNSENNMYKLGYGQQANQIRRQSFFDELGAYNAVNPSSLNPAIQNAQAQEQMAYGRMQNPGQMLQAAGSYFMPTQRNPYGQRGAVGPNGTTVGFGSGPQDGSMLLPGSQYPRVNVFGSPPAG